MATPADSAQITARGIPEMARRGAGVLGEQAQRVWFSAEVPDRPDDRR